jgi:hypothetical protein
VPYSGSFSLQINSMFVHFCNWSPDFLLIPCQSLALGRPPSIRLSYVDCEFPLDDEASVDDKGNTLVGCESLNAVICVF